MDVGPYAEQAWPYWGAGWRGVLPLPVGAKSPPPRGYTGWAGLVPSGADVQAWIDGPEGAGNIGLRMPMGVYGLDVDDYNGKSGGAALAELVARLGPLPPTWIVSSRDDSLSGIRLFHAELFTGRRWRDEPAGHAAGIEAIHYGHRYAVAWPSVHPDTGRKYVWRRPDGALAAPGELPAVDGLPRMPAAWVEALSELGEVRSGDMAGHAETLEVVNGWRVGEACPRVTAAADRGAARLREAVDGAALHPAGRDSTQELVALGHEGHVGARAALAGHYSTFVEVRTGRGEPHDKAAAEWWRLVRGAVGKLAGLQRAVCDCAVWAGEGLAFDYSPVTTAGDTGRIEVIQDDDESGGEGGVGGLTEALMSRLLTAAQLRDRPGPPALVEGLLSLDSASWLIAASGSYKSFVALDWAAHVAAGRPWMGREVARGPVVYVVAEGVAGMGPRIRAWEQRNGPMDEALHFLPMPVQAAQADHWEALVEACRRIGPALVVLDTQARVTVGLDENDNSQMGRFVEAVEQLRRASRACVLVVHHIGRNGQDARGASAIDGAQDTELRLTRTADRRVVLKIDKSRHADDDVRVELELFVAELDGGGTSLVVGPPLTAGAAVPDWRANLTLNQATLVEVMIDIFMPIGATKPELKGETRKRARRDALTDGRALEPMGESAFRRAWASLVDAGRFVRVTGSQRYVFLKITEGAGEVSE